MTTRWMVYLLGATLAVLPGMARAQPPATPVEQAPKTAPAEPTAAELQQQIVELQRQILQLQQQSLQELRRMRALLQQEAQRARAAAARIQPAAQPRPAPAPRKPVTVSTTASPSIGEADAPVTMVEFTDYECRFCARFYLTVYQELKTKYIDTGKLRFVSREHPLPMHRNAWKASVASHCAANQGKFWEMRDLLFRNQRQLQPDALLAYAETLDIDMTVFRSCFETDQPKVALERDMTDARAVGLTSTPNFVIGRTDAKTHTITGIPIIGARSFQDFAAAIDPLLAPATDDTTGE